MKLLWLCPIMLPAFAGYFNEKRNPKGGWITGSYLLLKDRYSIELICPAKHRDDTWKKDIVNNTTVYTLRRTDDLTNTLKEILLSSAPDIIQIWGTEKKMSLDMVNAAEELGMLDKVLIVLQGFISPESKYHFFCHLPVDVIQSESPAEYKYKISLQNQRDAMAKQGEYELEALRKAKYVVGRTEWDEACVLQINPKATYYRCYETLRDSFYQNRWKYDSCEKYSIFVSQSHYPVKGFHLMLEAMPLILEKYPTAKLYTTGKKPKVPETFVEKASALAYPAYIARLIKEYRLEDHVVFLGVLSEKAMCAQYMKSNVAVCSSSIEDESNSVAEAMLLGMPIVSAYVGGIIDFIEHKRSGYLYQSDAPYLLAHYVCKIFEEREQSIRMGKCARRKALKFFNREVKAQKMEEIYSLMGEV